MQTITTALAIALLAGSALAAPEGAGTKGAFDDAHAGRTLDFRPPKAEPKVWIEGDVGDAAADQPFEIGNLPCPTPATGCDENTKPPACPSPTGCWTTGHFTFIAQPPGGPLPKEFWDNPSYFCAVLEDVADKMAMYSIAKDIDALWQFDGGYLKCRRGQEPSIVREPGQ